MVDSCKKQANSQWFGQIKDLHPKLEASVTRVKRLLHITCLLDFSKAPHERNSQSLPFRMNVNFVKKIDPLTVIISIINTKSYKDASLTASELFSAREYSKIFASKSTECFTLGFIVKQKC